MRNFINTCLLLVGLVLIFYALVTLRFSNFSAGNPLTLAMGIVLASFRFLPDNKYTRIYTAFAAAGFVLFFVIIAIIVFMKPAEADGTEDAVVVLGCAVIGDRPSNTMRKRVNAAYEYSLKNPKAVFVLSGGKGPQEDVTEAYAMQKLMLELGVPEDRLILEEKATGTTENFVFSKELLDKHFNGKYKTAFVTNDFHCYRAGRLALLHGYDQITSIPAETPRTSLVLCYIREVLAVIKLWILKY